MLTKLWLKWPNREHEKSVGKEVSCCLRWCFTVKSDGQQSTGHGWRGMKWGKGVKFLIQPQLR